MQTLWPVSHAEHSDETHWAKTSHPVISASRVFSQAHQLCDSRFLSYLAVFKYIFYLYEWYVVIIANTSILLCAKHSSKCFAEVKSLSPLKTYGVFHLQTYFTGKEIVKWLAKSTQLGNNRSYGTNLDSLYVKSLFYILMLRKFDSKRL